MLSPVTDNLSFSNQRKGENDITMKFYDQPPWTLCGRAGIRTCDPWICSQMHCRLRCGARLWWLQQVLVLVRSPWFNMTYMVYLWYLINWVREPLCKQNNQFKCTTYEPVVKVSRFGFGFRLKLTKWVGTWYNVLVMSHRWSPCGFLLSRLPVYVRFGRDLELSTQLC